MHSSDSSPRQTTQSHAPSDSVTGSVSDSASTPQETGKAPLNWTNMMNECTGDRQSTSLNTSLLENQYASYISQRQKPTDHHNTQQLKLHMTRQQYP